MKLGRIFYIFGGEKVHAEIVKNDNSAVATRIFGSKF